MDAIVPGLALAPLDSARVVSTVYSLSLVTLVPFAGAAVAALAVRRMSAATRALVWRTAVVMLMVVAAAQLVPARWEAWVLPSALADPLVALGRHAVRSAVAAGGEPVRYLDGAAPTAALVIAVLCGAYLLGIGVVLTSIVRATVAARRLVASASPVDDAGWTALLVEVRRTLGISHPVPLLASDGCAAPMTAGVWHPVVLLPPALLRLPDVDRRAVLLHELAHIRSADVAYRLLAQLACAVFWFHPAAWWVARGLRRESEMACDDCVLGEGIRQSEYARLLVRVADRLHSQPVAPSGVRARPVAPALVGQGALRSRLAAITAVELDRRAPRGVAVTLAIAAAAALAIPLGIVKLAPTRDVLHALMADRRWESRAYAAIGLAPRTDSLAVAQHAANSDPSAHVRALASYALSRTAGTPAQDRGRTVSTSR